MTMDLTDLARVRFAHRDAQSLRVLIASAIDQADRIVERKFCGSLGDCARLVSDDAARLLARVDGLLHRLEDAEREVTDSEPRPAA